jgi:predicted 3-demethylubiquinone-9 3-methyltransferase (glyoxalase superfamily)
MHKITPHLWFDKEAKEAAELYTSLFEGSEITSVVTLHDTPSGDTDVVFFTLAGQPFQAISAGPLFKFNPSVSFMVACTSKDEVDELWRHLIEGGSEVMPLDTYPFSERYGWLEDRFGLSWQIGLFPDAPQKITPSLMFVGDVCGKAEEAIKFYAEVFGDAEVGDVFRYGPGQEPDSEDNVQYAAFTVERCNFSAMDSARANGFAFNEAICFKVHCDTQDEIDDYWNKLSAVPASEQCGWLKDRYGLSWQIVPRAMDRMMSEGDEAAVARLTQAFLPMKKLDIAKLEEAYAER